MRPNLKSKSLRPLFIEKELRLEQSKPFKTRYLWSGIPFEVQWEERFVNVWNLGFLPINIREFSFKLNYLHFFGNCPTNTNIFLQYFNYFLTNTNILWESHFIFIGAPSVHNYSSSLIINVEIILVAHLFFNVV